jgi:hypothetical protein
MLDPKTNALPLGYIPIRVSKLYTLSKQLLKIVFKELQN